MEECPLPDAANKLVEWSGENKEKPFGDKAKPSKPEPERKSSTESYNKPLDFELKGAIPGYSQRIGNGI
jgi:hypothetical protein